MLGAALAVRTERADLIEFGIEKRVVPFKRGEWLLKIVDRFTHPTTEPTSPLRWQRTYVTTTTGS